MSEIVSGVKHEVSVSSLPDLEREVQRLAKAYGQSCCPYIRLKNWQERKPRGFDAFCHGLQFIEFVEEKV